MTQSHPKRRIKLIDPGLQFRMVMGFASICAISLLVQALWFALATTKLAARMPDGGARLAQEIPWLVGQTLLVSFLLLLPAILPIGIRITFKVAGPLYRFRKHLESVAAGVWPGTCRIRKDDELQGLCEVLNAALERAREMQPVGDQVPERRDAA